MNDSRSNTEISFERPVLLYQIRLVTSGIAPHYRQKSGLTIRPQTEPIKNLEIFARDIANAHARYLPIISDPILKDFNNNDVIIPIPHGVRQPLRGETNLFIVFQN